MSTAAQATFAALDSELGLYVDRRILYAVLTDRNPPSEDALRDIHRVRDSLRARSAMLSELLTLYGAFGDLAAYDAATEVELGVRSLAAAANVYADAIAARTAPVSAKAQDALAAAASALATSAQNNRLIHASRAVRLCVQTVRELLESESHIHVSIRSAISENAGDLAVALAETGVASPHPLLRELLGSEHYAYDEKAGLAAWNANDALARKLREGVAGVVQHRTDTRLNAASGAFASLIEALHKLEEEHDAFEKGHALDLDGIAQVLASVRLFGDLLVRPQL